MANINRTSDSVRSDSSHGRIRETGIYLGYVKGNTDPQRMGRLAVYIPEFGGDPEDAATWFTMSYASPFAGATDVEKNSDDDAKKEDMDGTQKSYGWWAVPPDVNNQVLCCFVNGDTARGYWFACIYQQFMNHMVPALGINKSTKPEINEKNLPPVCEYNRKDDKQNYWDPARPVFEPLHNGLAQQGLYTDPERGPATTGARRESPSKVMGFISPRGNSIHIDDLEENEFIRLRTRSGVQLLIHETTGYIYMISKKGDSWMEISDEGIDMYSKRSISMRAEENINIHADSGVYINAATGSHNRTGNHTTGNTGNTNTVVAGNHQTTAGGNHGTSAAGGTTRNSPTIQDQGNPTPRQDVNGALGSASGSTGQAGGGGNSGGGSTGGTGIGEGGGGSTPSQ